MKLPTLRILLAVLTAVLAGCATFSNAEVQNMEQRGLPPQIVAKLRQGDPFTPAEIVMLHRRGVEESFLFEHLQDAGVNYLVSPHDIKKMRRAGISPRLTHKLLVEVDKFAVKRADPGRHSARDMWWWTAIYLEPELYVKDWDVPGRGF